MSAARSIPWQTKQDQWRASDPKLSAWVSAHAGSGKTHVLSQRVVRLLLARVPPSRILCLTYTKAAAANMAARIFDILAKAAAGRRQLKLSYRKPGGREFQTRVVDPYHLGNINGEWYLFAWCHLRRDIRTFVPARIAKADTAPTRLAPG